MRTCWIVMENNSNIEKETKGMIDGPIYYPEVLAVPADFFN